MLPTLQVKVEALAKWGRGVAAGDTGDAQAIMAWWSDEGAYSCSFCAFYAPWCSRCPLSTDNDGNCHHAYMAIQRTDGHHWDGSVSDVDFVRIFQAKAVEMLRAIEAVEVEPPATD